MKNCVLIFCTICLFVTSEAQSVSSKLEKAFRQFENDAQLSNAISSIYVLDGQTGNVVYEKHASIGLVPASTLKVVTSITAYELLGKDFRYQTEFTFSGNKSAGLLKVKGSGDPSLGSWRWPSTREDVVLGNIMKGLGEQSIQKVEEIFIDISNWEDETLPDGWILQDIGNYYGAGSEALNWRENQYDLFLKSGARVGDPVQIVGSVPELYGYKLESNLKSGPKGSGDKAYIFFPLQEGPGVVRGTIPAGESNFKISGSFPSGVKQFAGTLKREIEKSGKAANVDIVLVAGQTGGSVHNISTIPVYTHYSPTLDSLVYWLNKKSINLYAEALLKTISLKANGFAERKQSLELLKKFWKERGVQEAELNMVDGSGLSPLNRTTTRAQAAILLYAQKRPWFQGFYSSLPEFNGMKMKSGTIGGMKGFSGYHRSKEGKVYVFSFLVNNYNGSHSTLVQKMYRVLNELK